MCESGYRESGASDGVRKGVRVFAESGANIGTRASTGNGVSKGAKAGADDEMSECAGVMAEFRGIERVKVARVAAESGANEDARVGAQSGEYKVYDWQRSGGETSESGASQGARVGERGVTKSR